MKADVITNNTRVGILEGFMQVEVKDFNSNVEEEFQQVEDVCNSLELSIEEFKSCDAIGKNSHIK